MVSGHREKGIGTLLFKKGIITEEQLCEVLEYQNNCAGKRIGEILWEMNILGEDEILKQLADYMKVDYVVLHEKTYMLKKQRIFDKRTMLNYVFAPFDLKDKTLSIAINDIKNSELREKIETIAKDLKVEYYLSFPDMIKNFIRDSYSKTADHPAFGGKKEKFGEYLINKGILTNEQMAKVLEYQQKFIHKRLGEIICEMGLMNTEQALKELAAYMGREYKMLSKVECRQDLKGFFDISFMVRNNFVPFEKEGNTVKIAVSNIFDFELIQIIESKLERDNLQAQFYISNFKGIQKYIECIKNI